jgi:3-oxoacyl-[acyl-carrier-protein] synthase II
MAACISGIGIVSAVGTDRESTWQAVLAGNSGIRLCEGVADTPLFVGRVADDARPVSGAAAGFLLAAAAEALNQAGIERGPHLTADRGVYLGTTGSATGGEHSLWDLAQGLAEALGDACGAGGPRVAVNTACASGAHALALAVEHLRSGVVATAVVAGTDELSRHIANGFRAVKALDSFGACSPYGRSGGLSLGEGAAVLVLERVCERPGSPVLARIDGVGLSADAYHPTAPDPNGVGAELALRRALVQAGATLDDVDYVNGHGTGTRANDEMERKWLQRLWPDPARRPPMSATKSMTGHALGASAAIECAVTVLGIARGMLPPTAGASHATSEDPTDYVPATGRPAEVELAVATSYAFGGCNAAVALSHPRRTVPPEPRHRSVVLSGIGAFGAAGTGALAWRDALAAALVLGLPVEGFDDVVSLAPEPENKQYAPAHVWKKSDRLTKSLLASVDEALRDAGDPLAAVASETIGFLFATWGGAQDTFSDFVRGSASSRGLSPALVSSATVNAPAGAVSRRHGLKGPNMTIVSAGLGGWAALDHAVRLVSSGATDVMLVSGAELLGPALVAAYRDVGGRTDRTMLADGAVCLVIEAEEVAGRRGHRPYCRVLSGVARSIEPSTDSLYLAASYAETLRRSLEVLGWTPSSVVEILSAASGEEAFDAAEAAALADVLPRSLITEPKAIVGEFIAGALLVNVLAGAFMFEGDTDPEPRRSLVLARDTRGSLGILGLESADR